MRFTIHPAASAGHPHEHHASVAELDDAAAPHEPNLASFPSIAPAPGIVAEAAPAMPHLSPLAGLQRQLYEYVASQQPTPPPMPSGEQIYAPLPQEVYDDIEEYDEEEYVPTWRDKVAENQEVINTFVAGGLAGAASRTAVAPLERLKIILQVQNAQPGAQGKAYGGVWPSLVRMWKDEGFAGFMKGNGINVVRILPYSALQFTSYGFFKNTARELCDTETLSVPWRLAAGAGAGIVAVSATYPLDLVRARLSIATANMASGTAKSHFTAEDAKLGIVGMTKKVYRTEGGLRGLYRGCWATAVGVAPYVSLNFFGYETMKGLIMPEGQEMGDMEFAVRKLSCGGMAGAISLIFTHPFDVLRRKMQVSGLDGDNKGAIATLKDMIAEGFWKGMYRGLVPNLVKIVPSMAVSFYTFDTVHDGLARWENEEDEEESGEVA